jgi:hypothetical protein
MLLISENTFWMLLLSEDIVGMLLLSEDTLWLLHREDIHLSLTKQLCGILTIVNVFKQNKTFYVFHRLASEFQIGVKLSASPQIFREIGY